MHQTSDRDPADVFVSYASGDRDRVLAIADQLVQSGVRLWVDRHRIPGGGSYGPEIVRGIRGCQVLALMCSDAALRSRNVKQEVQLAWKYGKPYLPLLLEPVSFPEQLEYWLEGWQWVEVLDLPAEQWLPRVLASLALAGCAVPAVLAPAVQAVRPGAGLAGLFSLARLTDRIWPVAPQAVERGLSRSGLRDLGEAQDGVQRHFRLDERVCIALEAERQGHLLLLDQGASGKVYCLCPSWFAPETRIGAGRHYFPEQGTGYDAFVVTGRPGREHLLAIVSDEPLGLDWLSPEAEKRKAPARVLSKEDISTLLAGLESIPEDRWMVLSTGFDVAA